MESSLQQRVISWVNKVLSKLNYENIEVTFPEYESGGGLAAEMLFVDVVAVQNGCEKFHNLIIKKSFDSKVKEDELNYIEAYSNEINVYSKFLPYLQEFAIERNAGGFDDMPYCYGTVRGKEEYVLVLENLKPLGFKLHQLDKPLDLNHAKLVLQAYAKWHGLWLALKDQEPERFKEFAKCNEILTENKIFDYLAETTKNSLDFIIDFYRKKNNVNIIEKLEILKENTKDLLNKSVFNKEEEYQVIRHGDCWNNNFLFHYIEQQTDPDKVSIIDWQMSIIGSPVIDVTLFLFNTCSRTELEHIDDLLELYYNTLSKKITELGSDPNKCFPREAFLASFKKYAPAAIAGMPMICKMGYLDDFYKNFDMTQVEQDGNFSVLFDVELKDPEGYFNRVDGILQLCIERGFI